MTGQELIDLVTTFTGRNESTKHLTRLNVAQRKMWSDYEWSFGVRERGFVTSPAATATSTFTAQQSTGIGDFITGPALFFNALWADNTSRTVARLYVPSNGVFIKLIGPGPALNSAFVDGNVCAAWDIVGGGTFDANIFRIEYSLDNFSNSPDSNDSSYLDSNFGRFINAWVDGGDKDLDILSPSDWDRIVNPMDYGNRGRPTFATVVYDPVSSYSPNVMSSGTTDYGISLRVWPIPDDEYRIHYRYYMTPAVITATSTPFPNDSKWHQALAFYAAYLTRLDDIDNTRAEFFGEYNNLVDQMKWTYGVTPNATTDPLGPRQIDRQRSSSGFKPW